jgi:hypothetical protein
LKKLAAVVCLFLAIDALAGGSARALSESQSLTRSAPSAATEGMDLANVKGFRISVCAPSGQTLTGGTLNAWVYNYGSSLWMRNPLLDLTVTSNSVRCLAFPDQEVVAMMGARVLYAASSVTVSSGSAVTVRIDAWVE